MNGFRRRLLVAISIGVGLRLALVVASRWRIDYDEGMVGLLGIRLLHGEWQAFLPGEVNLGTLEPLLLAPLFAVLGATTITFRLYSLAMSALYVLTTALLARRAFGDRIALLSALFAAVAPPYLLILSLKTWGGTVETLILGNLLLILVADAVQPGIATSTRPRRVAFTGLVAGLMFWLAWLGFYYYAAAAVGVIYAIIWKRFRFSATTVIVCAGAFVLGSAPFWIHNAQNGWLSFSRMGATPFDLDEHRQIFTHLVRVLAPQTVTATPLWGTVGRTSRMAILLIYFAGLTALLIAPIQQSGRKTARLMIGALALAVPILYWLSPFGRNVLLPWDIDATGRYVVMLHSVLPIGAALLAGCLLQTKPAYLRAAGLAAAGLLLTINVDGAIRLDVRRAFDSPYYTRQPNSLEPLIAYLQREGIHHVWTDVGIAHVLMFETQMDILAADYYESVVAGGVNRFPDVLDAVDRASHVALVLPVYTGQVDPPIERALEQAGVAFHAEQVTPQLRVYVPQQPFDIETVAGGLGYQY